MQTAQTTPVVTIVTGLPRSGTSMLMQMLGAGGMPVLTDGVRRPDASNPRGYFEFEPVKRTRQDSRWLEQAAGKAVKLVHLLVPDLPGGYTYRVLFIERDLTEVLASQQAMLRHDGRRGADLPPKRLAEVFAAQLQRVADWVERQPHFSLLRLDFHQIIADPFAEAARINLFLGGGLDDRGMAAAVDPTLYRQRGR